jgi:hypothetical protein
MRIQAFRAWFTTALRQGVDTARRAGLAIHRKIKQATGRIEISVGVGDDESRFGGSGSRAWIEIIEEYRKKLLELFERSSFERFPRFERFMRRLLGGSSALKKTAPELEKPAHARATQIVAAAPAMNPKEAERLRAEVRRGMLQAHQHEHAGLRERVSKHRASGASEPAAPAPGAEKDHS